MSGSFDLISFILESRIVWLENWNGWNYSPLVRLLHLDGHVGHPLADLADELDHVLRGQ